MKKLRTDPPTLPIEIFYQHIFVNLPVKSLLRFKGVCREWNDVIKEANFVRMHLHHAKQRNNSQKLMIYSYTLNKLYSLDHQTIRGDDYIQAVKLHNPFCCLPLVILRMIAGSVNGLVCISCVTDVDDSSTILIWNPTTRVHKILPPHPDVPLNRIHPIGFGYNSTADDYNFVRILLCGKGSRIDIYSLKTNSWKLFMYGKDIPGHSPRFQKRCRVCSVDGSIYWLAYHKPPHKDLCIACFDLDKVDDDEKKKKLTREISMPRDFDIEYAWLDLKVLGGCLCVLKLGINFETRQMWIVIWSMMKINENKNDEVEYRWTNRVVINTSSYLTRGISNGRFVEPICLSKDGKIILRIPDNTPNEFVLYDTETKSIKNLHTLWFSELGDSQMYIESLISPNFMS